MPPSPVSFERATMLARLADETFDVVVVGGGITGVGVALDAASRGLRVGLVERDDFSSGTSSRSSKLVHGGLRYLQNREIRLVYEGLAERQRLFKLAPHLVKLLPFMIPILTRDGVINPKIARALGSAMWMYDLTGGVRIGRFHERLSSEEALAHLPTMSADRLASAYLYYDAQTDDARLCLTVARTAAAHGAVVANHAAVVGMGKDASGGVDRVMVEADGRRFDVRTRLVVNATGVWADDLRALDEGTHPSTIRPAKGIHLTVPWTKVRNDIAVVIPVPRDKRSLFVVPWGDLTYVGTTDTDYDGPLEEPQCTPEDIGYVLNALNHAVTTKITPADVTGTWAGLRPLVKAATSGRTADLSRRHSVTTSGSGVVTVTGGKLTTYRRMAADAVDVAAARLGIGEPSRTARIPLLGAEGYTDPPPGSSEATHLASRYGSEAPLVEALLDSDGSLARPLVPGLPYLRGEAVWAVRHEMARTLDDVLSRRARARILARDDSVAAAADVAALLAPELGWDRAETQRQVDQYTAAARAERTSAGLPEAYLAAALAPAAPAPGRDGADRAQAPAGRR